MNYLKILSLSFLLLACINEESLKPVMPEFLIHNNASKIWLLQKIETDDTVLEPVLKENTTTYTFFEDHDFYVQQLIHLGSHEGTKGSYTLSFRNEGDTALVMYLPDASQKVFKVLSLTVDELHLQLLDTIDKKEEWFFKSYTKPF